MRNLPLLQQGKSALPLYHKFTITRRDDGTYRPNFRPMKVGADFTVEKYAAGVANELLWALEGLIEE